MGDLLLFAILAGLVIWKWRPNRAATRASDEPMGRAEARALLGVGQDAAEADIRAAYARLIRLAHPDRGGTHGLAAQLNRARDVLLKR